MSEINFSQAFQEREIKAAQSRNLFRDRLFVLLLGPSATGKSTIISELNRQPGDERFLYVKPIMTRPNRPLETDKVSVENEIFDAMDAQGEFVIVNNLYGVRYGTPLNSILDPLQRGKTPILDYPLSTVGAIRRPEYETLKVYVYPPSIEQWRLRVESSGRNSNGRVESGLAELAMLKTMNYIHSDIDLSVVNYEGRADEVANSILKAINIMTA